MVLGSVRGSLAYIYDLRAGGESGVVALAFLSFSISNVRMAYIRYTEGMALSMIGEHREVEKGLQA